MPSGEEGRGLSEDANPGGVFWRRGRVGGKIQPSSGRWNARPRRPGGVNPLYSGGGCPARALPLSLPALTKSHLLPVSKIISSPWRPPTAVFQASPYQCHVAQPHSSAQERTPGTDKCAQASSACLSTTDPLVFLSLQRTHNRNDALCTTGLDTRHLSDATTPASTKLRRSRHRLKALASPSYPLHNRGR